VPDQSNRSQTEDQIRQVQPFEAGAIARPERPQQFLHPPCSTQFPLNHQANTFKIFIIYQWHMKFTALLGLLQSSNHQAN